LNRTHVTLDPSVGKITKSELTLTAKVPGITEEEFQKYAKIAEEGCPVSAAFNFEITLNAALA
ncbi:OsmC family peroxiredoxin, partial [Flavobacteriaceae bacterium W22]|nr:OsmC family peroxiredoxin [Flavobacteriaceae bacterium W22]